MYMNNINDVATGQRVVNEMRLKVASGKIIGVGETYNLPASRLLDGLVQKIVSQEIVDYLKFNYGSVGFYNTNEDWINGLKSYVSQSIFELTKDKDITADLVIGDFNASLNDFKEYVVHTTEKFFLKYPMYTKEIYDAFTTTGKLGEFVSQMVKRATQTWDLMYFNFYNSFMWGINNPDINADAASFDKTINVITTAESTTEAGMLKVLTAIRNKLIELKVPSKTHLKINQDKFIYANQSGENLVLLVNKKYYTQFQNLTSKLYNPNDVLSKLEMKPVAIELLKGYAAQTDEIKIAVLADTRKFRVGYFIKGLTSTTNLPLFRTLTEMYNEFGVAQLSTFPAYLYQVGAATRSTKIVDKTETIPAP